MKRIIPVIILTILLNNLSFAYKTHNKKDTTVIEFDRNNRLLIPEIYTDESGLESQLFMAFPDVQRKDLLEFELSYFGVNGQIPDYELIFEVGEEFMIYSIQYKFSRALYFSEEGSGVTRSASGEYFTEWRDLEKVDPNVYHTPDYEAAKPFPEIPKEAIMAAESELEKNPLLDYSEYSGSFKIKIDYNINNKRYNKEIIFYYMHGD